MRKADITRVIAELFDAIGEFAAAAKLRRKTAGAHAPGTAAAETVSETLIRAVPIARPLRAGDNAASALLDAPHRYALIECASLTPRAGDEIEIGGVRFTLLQVAAMDAGAGALYEVTYR